MNGWDFFAFKDNRLFDENYADDIGSSEYLGSLDDYEFKLMYDMWENCGGVEKGMWDTSVIKIPSHRLNQIISKMKAFAIPNNLWHREIKAKLIDMFERASQKEMGLLVTK